MGPFLSEITVKIMTESIHFDVIVVGGGHAGIEACHAAAKMGCKTLLVTLDENKIGLMPCNPSVGGLGKGHIVYEVAALGGLMPELCSETYLQARMLNTSKGPAVQGLRLQIDKFAYQKEAQRRLTQMPNLTIVSDMVESLLFEAKGEHKKITGLTTRTGRTYTAAAVVITTGTFLNGLVHIGLTNFGAGRQDEEPSVKLSASVSEVMNIKLGRLKTGTPPRIKKHTVDFSKLAYQPSDKLNALFEFKDMKSVEKEPCYIAHTNEKTHDIIRANLHKSAMYSGNIKGVGPRYCPSIEDKIGRFPQRTSHHVFIEPEGLDHEELYPAGLSTSLPVDIQYDYLRSIVGLEKVEIARPGYAVEYDFIQPSHLSHTLEAQGVEGLFCAGQLNGTTGYEEAAGQGIVAGINAALKAKGKEQITLSRTNSYIGIMIDDLITLGVDEPYRMFTSRAERRLILRQDNVFSRLMPLGYQLGMVTQPLFEKFQEEQELINFSVQKIKAVRPQGEIFKKFNEFDFTETARTEARNALVELLAQKEKNTDALSDRAILSIHAEIRYDGYLAREEKEAAKTIKFAELAIPEDFDFTNVNGLSIELQQKLTRHRPKSISQAHIIPGITPAALSLLIFRVREATDKL